ncbi:hypothetical protein RHMOL_Rhmol02G0225300 [Rhododendron molle]|uniref:Uncharacterized protein n=1 Tax=Rhododendron molle TaxID=49168 RepID=A0ACC0PST5_RHOML|nr:hypothetical protein RHMOL_Rhmol02G0225300 [Rhododendron molle]
MPVARRISRWASSSLSRPRARMETRAPWEAAWWAMARPMPLDPPVMKTWRSLMGILTGRGRRMRGRRRRRERGRRRRRERRERVAIGERE